MMPDPKEVVRVLNLSADRVRAATASGSPPREVLEELADTFVYLTKIADHFGIDLVEAALEKMDKNERKYPAALNQGRIRKRRR